MSDPIDYLWVQDKAHCDACDTRKRLEAEVAELRKRRDELLASNNEFEQRYRDAKARALAAEMALADIALKFEAWQVMDGSQADTVRIFNGVGAMANSIDLTAAREMREKAEKVDQIIADEQKIAVNAQREAAALRTQLQASEALVERYRTACSRIEQGCSFPEDEVQKAILTVVRPLLTLTPAAALSGYRNEVLEEVAKHCEETELLMKIPEPGTTMRQHGADVCQAMAAEIRAMKGGAK